MKLLRASYILTVTFCTTRPHISWTMVLSPRTQNNSRHPALQHDLRLTTAGDDLFHARKFLEWKRHRHLFAKVGVLRGISGKALGGRLSMHFVAM